MHDGDKARKDVLDWAHSARFDDWLRRLPEKRRADVCRQFADELARLGYAMEREQPDGTLRPEPIFAVVSPAVVDDDALAAVHRDARLVLAATTRLARWALGPEAGDAGQRLFAALSPLEHAALSADPERMAGIGSARSDLLVDAEGRPWLLEQNTTIPALHGFSDMVTGGWVRAFTGSDEGWTSNTDELLGSLVAHHERIAAVCGVAERPEKPSVVLVSRRRDPERPELAHMAARFARAGHRARHAYADEIELSPSGRVSVDGEGFDILYRHIFSRLVGPEWPMYGLMVAPGPVALLNPVTGPLEVKAMLTMLHEMAHEPDSKPVVALGDEELDAISRLVPWSRVLRSGPAVGPGEERIDDLGKWCKAHARELVLKRSWDHGGRSVHIGEDSSQWEDIVDAALGSGEMWIVQRVIRAPRRTLLAVEGDRLVEKSLVTDLSVYLNQGVPVCPTGATVRASPGRIVNVASGGALVPMVSRDLVARVMT